MRNIDVLVITRLAGNYPNHTSHNLETANPDSARFIINGGRESKGPFISNGGINIIKIRIAGREDKSFLCKEGRSILF